MNENNNAFAERLKRKRAHKIRCTNCEREAAVGIDGTHVCPGLPQEVIAAKEYLWMGCTDEDLCGDCGFCPEHEKELRRRAGIRQVWQLEQRETKAKRRVEADVKARIAHGATTDALTSRDKKLLAKAMHDMILNGDAHITQIDKQQDGFTPQVRMTMTMTFWEDKLIEAVAKHQPPGPPLEGLGNMPTVQELADATRPKKPKRKALKKPPLSAHDR